MYLFFRNNLLLMNCSDWLCIYEIEKDICENDLKLIFISDWAVNSKYSTVIYPRWNLSVLNKM